MCIEVDLVSQTGRAPVSRTGPLSLLSRTGRWSLLREEGLDLLNLPPAQKADVLQQRKVFLTPDAFTDFFGPPMEFHDDQDQ